MMRDFFYGLGEAFDGLWAIMPAIGDTPNNISILVIAGFFIYWVSKLIQYKRNGEA